MKRDLLKSILNLLLLLVLLFFFMVGYIVIAIAGTTIHLQVKEDNRFYAKFAKFDWFFVLGYVKIKCSFIIFFIPMYTFGFLFFILLFLLERYLIVPHWFSTFAGQKRPCWVGFSSACVIFVYFLCYLFFIIFLTAFLFILFWILFHQYTGRDKIIHKIHTQIYYSIIFWLYSCFEVVNVIENLIKFVEIPL